MTDYTRKRISVNQIKIHMELAENVIAPNGMLLIPKDTSITEKHIFRMNLYQILSVVIKEYSPVMDATETLTEQERQVYNKEHPGSDQESIVAYEPKSINYQNFKETFVQVESSVKNELLAISDGKNIDPERLIKSTETLMGSLRLKSELFNYMNHLRSDIGHTYVHSLNVSMLCNIFGHWLKMPSDEIEDLTLAGLVHDIGKTQIDQTILNKPGRLSEEEFVTVKQHALLGYNLLKDQDIPERVKQGVLMHHERNDGSGYPFGLKGDSISDFGKILAILDTYDAMTSNRTYHQKFSPFKVIQMFEQESYGFLDARFLYIFLENIAHNYLGESVRLSDQRKGKIVFIHNTSPSKPIVQINQEIIDLMTSPHLAIEEIL
ncbi:MAG: hypothetical protein CVV00_08440 [Firmicutes bacterium HGW-Firmicutes-5]|nr:MAG: hypothetical protein CVV00_08440 [Firmicutes bacterium HGW-Firmicutes-5]